MTNKYPVDIRPMTTGPDYDGKVRLSLPIDSGNLSVNEHGNAVVHIVVDRATSEKLFGKLGSALEFIKANMDPEGD